MCLPHILPLRAGIVATKFLPPRQASTAAPCIPRSHFSSLARLDQDRLSAMLAEELSSDYIPSFSSEPSIATATVVSISSACFGFCRWCNLCSKAVGYYVAMFIRPNTRCVELTLMKAAPPQTSAEDGFPFLFSHWRRDEMSTFGGRTSGLKSAEHRLKISRTPLPLP